MDWHIKEFEQLTTNELYLILKLRCEVFVVEQNCVYPDIDDLDRASHVRHLFAKSNNIVCCYLRVLPPDISFPNMTSFGRVVIHSASRGAGLGHELMQRTLAEIDRLWPDKDCHISAQSYLKKYYAKHGFTMVGEEYLEDGIPHIGMERCHL